MNLIYLKDLIHPVLQKSYTIVIITTATYTGLENNVTRLEMWVNHKNTDCHHCCYTEQYKVTNL